MKRFRFRKQFNWRMLLVRIFVNALTLLIIAILPDIYFVEPTVLRVLFVALVLGILNAFVKPIIQFLTLRFIFITYGFAIVIINAIILLLLSILLPGMFAVDSLLWVILGSALMGLVTAFFENLLGLQIPILPENLTPQPAPAADPSLAFQTKIAGEVMGPDEQLVPEVPLANEAEEPAAAGDTAQQGEER